MRCDSYLSAYSSRFKPSGHAKFTSNVRQSSPISTENNLIAIPIVAFSKESCNHSQIAALFHLSSLHVICIDHILCQCFSHVDYLYVSLESMKTTSLTDCPQPVAHAKCYNKPDTPLQASECVVDEFPSQSDCICNKILK